LILSHETLLYQKMDCFLKYDSTVIGKRLACDDIKKEPTPWPWALGKAGYFKWKLKKKFNKLTNFEFAFSDTNKIKIDSLRIFWRGYRAKIWYTTKNSGEVELIATSKKESIQLVKKIIIKDNNKVEIPIAESPGHVTPSK